MTALKIGSLFSGVGGLDMAVEEFFGAEAAWHCEFEPEPSKVLAARWPGVPNLGDVTQVDWSSVEPVDVLCGGFPCQDLSLAGRRAGMRPGTRSGLWSDFVRAIRELKPKVVVIENVRGLLSGCAESASDSEMGPCPRCVDPDGGASHSPNVRALGRVLGDLSDLGFDAEWHGLLASDVGAPHGRFRVFVLAYARGVRLGAWRGAVAGEASGGWSSAVDSGRGDAPVALFRTPAAAELEGGRRNPDRPGATMRLRDQIAEEQERGMLLPTPVAQPSGNTPEDHLRKKPGREVVTDLAILVENDLMKTGGKLLPTPQVADMQGGHATRSGDRSNEMLLPGVAVAATEGRLADRRLFSTPDTVPEAPNTGSNSHKAGNIVGLGNQVRSLLPTPSAMSPSEQEPIDEWLERRARVKESAGNGFGTPLGVAVRMLPTPRASRGAASTETMYALGAERDDTGDKQGNVVGAVEWGEYEPAVRLWESLTRPAPAPTLPDGKNGNHRLAAVFPEWMMGYPAGWVTDVIGRNPAIKACGNGVVPQQAYAALGVLWSRVMEEGAA